MRQRLNVVSVNVLVPISLVRRLDAAVIAERKVAISRVSRSSIVRDALLARLGVPASPAAKRPKRCPSAGAIVARRAG